MYIYIQVLKNQSRSQWNSNITEAEFLWYWQYKVTNTRPTIAHDEL